MKLQYLLKYQSFESVKEMDERVQEHIQVHYEKLTPSEIEVLLYLASRSLTAVGASHLLTETIAKDLGVSTKTIYRATKKLSDLGIIMKHKTTKRTGQGASIYVIAPIIKMTNVCHSMSKRCPSLETHVKPVIPTDSHVKNETVTKNLITTSFNPFVNSYSTYSAHGVQQDVKEQLRAIYQPYSVEDNATFEELCKIAFGRLKQYMNSHNIPYLQMTDIVINCMKSLVNKENVKNEFALYSAMIKRQVEQLFEAHIKPVQAFKGTNRELVPDWFEKRNETVTSVNNEQIDFETERQKILAKIGQ